MPENFVLERRKRNQSKRERWSTIRVKADTYQIIAEWAYQTGKPISEVTRMAISYRKGARGNCRRLKGPGDVRDSA